MKPTHLTPDNQPAIYFRPPISATGPMIHAATLRLIHDKAKVINEATIVESLKTNLGRLGTSITSELDGPFPAERDLALAYAATLFPDFFPNEGEDAMSRHRALVDIARTGTKKTKVKKVDPADADGDEDASSDDTAADGQPPLSSLSLTVTDDMKAAASQPADKKRRGRPGKQK
jgi:hypothetical protein